MQRTEGRFGLAQFASGARLGRRALALGFRVLGSGVLGSGVLGFGALGCGDTARPAPPGLLDAGLNPHPSWQDGGQLNRPDATIDRCPPSKEPFGIDPDFNQSMPDIQLMACDGSMVTLDEMRCGNKATLISIGAGWCEPCEEEAIIMEELHEKYAEKGLGVVQLMYADREGYVAGAEFCVSWREAFELSYPVYSDPQRNTHQFFNLGITPLNIIVNAKGKVLWSGYGILPNDIEKVIQSLL